MNVGGNSNEVMETESEVEEREVIVESFEEILSEYEVIEREACIGATEPLCASCLGPVDVDEEQDIAYCERCQTTVFVERREIR